MESLHGTIIALSNGSVPSLTHRLRPPILI